MENTANSLGGELKREVKQGLREGYETELKALHGIREEIRLQLHLAGLEAKAKWEELEPQVERLEGMAQTAGDGARDLAKDLLQSFKTFRDTLKHA